MLRHGLDQFFGNLRAILNRRRVTEAKEVLAVRQRRVERVLTDDADRRHAAEVCDLAVVPEHDQEVAVHRVAGTGSIAPASSRASTRVRRCRVRRPLRW
jgi:hypothetical protein